MRSWSSKSLLFCVAAMLTPAAAWAQTGEPQLVEKEGAGTRTKNEKTRRASATHRGRAAAWPPGALGRELASAAPGGHDAPGLSKRRTTRKGRRWEMERPRTRRAATM